MDNTKDKDPAVVEDGEDDEEENKNLTVGFFYERKVPDTDELVMVRVNSIDDVGVSCHLLEYNNLEGFLPLSEISRKRMRSVLRHVRTGQKQVLQVLRVDPERGFVDLSKKYITDVERKLVQKSTTRAKLPIVSRAMLVRSLTKKRMIFIRNMCGHCTTQTTVTLVMPLKLLLLKESLFGRMLKTRTKILLKLSPKL